MGENGTTTAPERFVLVVEDNRMNLILAREVLSREGLASEPARTGAEARALLEERLPAAVVLDIQLPDTDGFELAAELKSDPRTRDIPIVVLSGRDLDADRERAVGIGCADYMTKPLDIQVFGSRLKALMGVPAD
ncbi:MAG: response regulator [Candidatus Dormibacteria bacterium]